MITVLADTSALVSLEIMQGINKAEGDMETLSILVDLEN